MRLWMQPGKDLVNARRDHSRQQRRRGVALVASLAAATGALAGCSGGPGGSAPSGPASWLSSIPDTAAYRSLIAVNDLRTLWTSAGLSFPPAVARLRSAAGSAASRQIGRGSPLGTELLSISGFTGRPLGYSPLAISSEVAAGSPPNQLSLVNGTIDASKLKMALSHLGARPAATGSVVTYTYRYNLRTSSPVAGALIGVRHIAVAGGGDRAASGGPGAPSGDVAGLLKGSRPSRSLASDADVRQMLGLLKGADVMLFGTSLIINWERGILGIHAAPAQVAALRHRYPGLARLPAATFGGYGYLPGNPEHGTAVAVSIYPSSNDATTAASVLGTMLRSGTSFLTSKPYAKLFAVDKITVDGHAVVARITTHASWTLAQAAQQGDFPLFWTSKSTA